MNEQENTKVISIRLIYVVLILIAMIGVIVFGVKYRNTQKVQKLAERALEAEAKEETQIVTREAATTSSRSEDLTRKEVNEEKQEIEEEVVEENNISEQTEQEITQLEEDKEEEEIVNATEEVQEEKVNYIPIDEVKISQNMDLTVNTGLSREDFIKLIAGVKADKSGFFEENAGTIYDLCNQYSLNEIFFCGIISAESGWEIAANHRRTHNYISLMSKGKLISYSSVNAGLQEAARVLHTNYLTPRGKYYYGKTLSAVKTKFCPSSSTWVSLVYGRMCEIVK